jgi:hypothetical protein
MSIWTMSKAQQKALAAGEITPMPVGVFRCAEDDCYDRLWEAPLEDWWEPKCPECTQPAVLVQVV